MDLQKAIEGYFYDKEATYSSATLDAYTYVFRRLVQYMENKDISDVTPEDLHKWILWVRDDYEPGRLSGDKSPLSQSGVDLYWKATRSLFNWAHKALGVQRPDLEMPRPSFKRPMVVPFSEEEVRRLLRACEYKTAKSRAGKSYQQHLPYAQRDKALILTLLDTGVRLGELLRIKIQDINFETGEILVAPYGTGKKTKPRVVTLGSTAKRTLWLYVARMEESRPVDRLFPMTATAVRLMMNRLGKRAEVSNVHPHRFRHSFAIWYLRNGGDVFTLQRMLGHSTLEMTNYYLDIAQSDIAQAHRRSSAVDRWNRDKPF